MIFSQRDRLISQQGLNVARSGTAFKQGTRLVQDKRYFLGALQLKIGELTQELSTIHKSLEQNAKDQATFSIYDKRVKQMASELTGEMESKFEFVLPCLTPLFITKILVMWFIFV